MPADVDNGECRGAPDKVINQHTHPPLCCQQIGTGQFKIHAELDEPGDRHESCGEKDIFSIAGWLTQVQADAFIAFW